MSIGRFRRIRGKASDPDVGTASGAWGRCLLPVAAVTALAAALRFPTLGDQSLWLDEAITVDLLRSGFVDMVRAIPSSESTPPLYYLLAWPWAKVFGTGEVGVRAFSALCGTAIVPVAYGAGQILVSRRAGLIAAALAATSPLLVWYSQEARAYALFALLGALSFLLFVAALRRPSRGVLTGWVAISALALATHYFAVSLVAAEAALLLVLAPRRAAVAASSAAIGAFGLALVPLAVHQERGGRTSWIADTGLSERAEDVVRQFVAGAYPLPHELKLAAVLAAVVAAFLVFRSRADERRSAFLALAVGALTVGLPVAPALAGADYFLYRNVLLAWVPLALVVAIALASERARWAGAVVAAALVVTSLGVVIATASREDLARDDWRSVADTLATPGEKVVVLSPAFERSPLEYYRPEVRAIGIGSAGVAEIILLGYPEGDEAFPPRWFRVPEMFERVESRLLDRVRLIRYRASRTVPVGAADVGRPRGSPALVLVDMGGR